MTTPPSFKEALQASQESLPGSPVASAERLGHSWLQRSLESVIFPPAVCPAKRQLSITREEEVVGYWEQLAPAVSATVLWGREARLRRRGWLIALPPPPRPGAMRFHQSNPPCPAPQLFAGTGAVFGRICGAKREVVLGMAPE